MLRVALDHHAEAGDGPCPVCRTGTLDEQWRATASASLEELRVTTVATQRAASREAELSRRIRP